MKRGAEIPYMGDGGPEGRCDEDPDQTLDGASTCEPAALALGESRTHRLGSHEEGIA